ncbi:MAG: 2-oxoglutarate dehydrogenase complex dihydrolipoyllysine-residue succinyltransferase, partial [Opitutus sp.]
MSLIEVKIPPMGESISSGVLAKWHVNDGDVVKKDQPLFELETDKITSEGTAESAGRISLKVAAGDEVAIGQVVAMIDPAGNPAPSAKPEPAATLAGAIPKPGSAPSVDLKSEISNFKSGGEAAISPAVRRIAAETGIDPAGVPGTGKGGRVTKGDMLEAAAGGGAGERREAKGERSEPAEPPAPSSPDSKPATAPAIADNRQTRRKMSQLRAKIAQRLVAAQHEAAMLTTFNEADMSAVIALRARYQDEFVKKNGLKLGFMSFFAKAVVHALKEVPGVNALLDGDSIIENHYYDIGIAVSTERGLMVPVIRDCDTLGMAGIEKAIADAARRAREGGITLADLEGGVFTITNGGIFGSMLSTPIINPPQSAILGLHAINDRPVALNGQVVIRPMMY